MTENWPHPSLRTHDPRGLKFLFEWSVWQHFSRRTSAPPRGPEIYSCIMMTKIWYTNIVNFMTPKVGVVKLVCGHIRSIVEMLKHLLKNYTGPIFTKVGLFLRKLHANIDDNYVACWHNLICTDVRGRNIYEVDRWRYHPCLITYEMLPKTARPWYDDHGWPASKKRIASTSY